MRKWWKIKGPIKMVLDKSTNRMRRWWKRKQQEDKEMVEKKAAIGREDDGRQRSNRMRR
jgi:hypothetical protein